METVRKLKFWPTSEGLKWPKTPPPLTAEQKQLQVDFLRLWHEILPKKYQAIETFNHACRLIRQSVKPGGCKTLEIGAGLGEHLLYENLEGQDYTSLEIRSDFADVIRKKFPTVKVIESDIQENTGLPSASFDRILGIHVLEHLRNLPLALQEIKRLLKPDGTFVVVIPCEGGMAYTLARNISARRVFEKTFKVSYTDIIKNEHVSDAWEILHELKKVFEIKRTQYWPLMVPVVTTNLVAALECKIKR